MQKYRKKPVVIEAIKWSGKNIDEVIDFCKGAATYEGLAGGGGALIIGTLEDNEELKIKHAATVGDMIIKGVQGEFYPCKPDIFEETYEAV